MSAYLIKFLCIHCNEHDYWSILHEVKAKIWIVLLLFVQLGMQSFLCSMCPVNVNFLVCRCCTNCTNETVFPPFICNSRVTREVKLFHIESSTICLLQTSLTQKVPICIQSFRNHSNSTSRRCLELY